MLEMHKPGLKFSVGGKTDIRKTKQPPSLAPNHYSINYKSQDIKQPMSTFPKEKSANFIDQTVLSLFSFIFIFSHLSRVGYVCALHVRRYMDISSHDIETRTPFLKTRHRNNRQVRSKSWQPAPGKYDLIKVEKYSRGTKYCQVNNIARCAVNGLF